MEEGWTYRLNWDFVSKYFFFNFFIKQNLDYQYEGWEGKGQGEWLRWEEAFSIWMIRYYYNRFQKGEGYVLSIYRFF